MANKKNRMNIGVKSIAPLFQQASGLPKKECLMSTGEIMEAIGVVESGDSVHDKFNRNLTQIAINQTKYMFRDNNCYFICPKIDGNVRYGFSKKEENIINSIERELKRNRNSKNRLVSSIDMARDFLSQHEIKQIKKDVDKIEDI